MSDRRFDGLPTNGGRSLQDERADALRQALAAAAPGRSEGVDQLARCLLALDRLNDPGMDGEVADLLLKASPRAWLALDVVSRKAWFMAPYWSRLVEPVVVPGTRSLVPSILASFHPNGHVREAAVKQLSRRSEEVVAIPLAIRCSDWVGQVRTPARDAVAVRLEKPTAETVMGLTPVAVALQNRREGSWVVGRIESALHRDAGGLLDASLRA